MLAVQPVLYVCCGYFALSKSKFVCKACGETANADINGTRNILTVGHSVSDCK
ncbi:transposase [Salmonella enterica]|nr:transposase [Salmonella enterica]EJU4495023.1 transposase [Salmonella enterica]EJV1145034.1 transposase [Salmonella enterica]HCM3757620.1 transposase [Salmonella enterica subsp. enterica serovar London]